MVMIVVIYLGKPMNINVTYPDTRNVNYTYDEAGNRTSMVETEKTGATPVTTTYQYNEVNEMMSLVKGNDTTNYTYDQDGNTLTKANTAGTTYYHWNLKGELAATELPGNKSNVMEYDMNGMRIRYTTADNVTTNYVYEGLGTVMEIVGTRVTKKYYSGISMVIPENPGKSCKQTYYYLYDGLGDVVNLTDEAGNLVQTYYFDAFGKSTNVRHDCVNKKQFTGKEIDEDSGLHYFGARYYDAGVGRFISEDPKENDNLYVYCVNNPINKTDPDGRAQISINTQTASWEISTDINLGKIYASHGTILAVNFNLYFRSTAKLDPISKESVSVHENTHSKQANESIFAAVLGSIINLGPSMSSQKEIQAYKAQLDYLDNKKAKLEHDITNAQNNNHEDEVKKISRELNKVNSFYEVIRNTMKENYYTTNRDMETEKNENSK